MAFTRRSVIVLIALLVATYIPARASDRDATDRGATQAAVTEMAERIDEHLLERMRDLQIEPGGNSSDSEFIRRAYLDLLGVIPRVSEVREFLADDNRAKRAALIDRLLASPRHATHMANTWRQIMLPGGVDLEQLQNVSGVQNWLRRQFASNLRYDRLVNDFLVATGGGEAGPALYYTSLELNPEKLAASTSRIFLGLQIECAECHDHPFDHWKQQDFWGYAAFFARLDQSGDMQMQQNLVDLPEGEVTLPETETVVLPKYPDGRKADEADGGTRRVQLAIWMASRDNPYLARAAVNRVWAHMFGRGLVNPVDDLGEHNPPSHPAMMKDLTAYFVEHGFDMRELFRVLANTRAYQRTSRFEGESPPENAFAVMSLKTMSAEQLYDSLDRVLLRSANAAPTFLPAAQGSFDPRRLAFLAKMQMQGANATEFQAGVLQALTLLNGTEIAAMTQVEQSGLLQALEAPWLEESDRVETLFLATISRLPSDDERTLFLDYVQSADSDAARTSALGDVLWALLNSAEFTLNH